MRDVSELLATQNNQNIFFSQHSEFPVQKENICIIKPYRIVLFLQQITFYFFFFFLICKTFSSHWPPFFYMRRVLHRLQVGNWEKKLIRSRFRVHLPNCRDPKK